MGRKARARVHLSDVISGTTEYEAIIAIYQRCNPAKLGDVTSLISQYGETKLLNALLEKYGEPALEAMTAEQSPTRAGSSLDVAISTTPGALHEEAVTEMQEFAAEAEHYRVRDANRLRRREKHQQRMERASAKAAAKCDTSNGAAASNASPSFCTNLTKASKKGLLDNLSYKEYKNLLRDASVYGRDGQAIMKTFDAEQGVISEIDISDHRLCSVCSEPFCRPTALKCRHIFCRNCLLKVALKGRGLGSCPLCRQAFDIKADFMCNENCKQLEREVADAFPGTIGKRARSHKCERRTLLESLKRLQMRTDEDGNHNEESSEFDGSSNFIMDDDFDYSSDAESDESELDEIVSDDSHAAELERDVPNANPRAPLCEAPEIKNLAAYLRLRVTCATVDVTAMWATCGDLMTASLARMRLILSRMLCARRA